MRRLSENFYDKVFADKETKWFLNIFSSSTRSEAVENQYLFFVQTFGGPALYKHKKGKYTRLVGRHSNYNIGRNAAIRWVEHMAAAIEEHDLLKQDEEAREALYKYFQYTAHYIVVASKYMRPDQACNTILEAFVLFSIRVSMYELCWSNDVESLRFHPTWFRFLFLSNYSSAEWWNADRRWTSMVGDRLKASILLHP